MLYGECMSSRELEMFGLLTGTTGLVMRTLVRLSPRPTRRADIARLSHPDQISVFAVGRAVTRLIDAGLVVVEGSQGLLWAVDHPMAAELQHAIWLATGEQLGGIPRSGRLNDPMEISRLSHHAELRLPPSTETKARLPSEIIRPTGVQSRLMSERVGELHAHAIAIRDGIRTASARWGGGRSGDHIRLFLSPPEHVWSARACLLSSASGRMDRAAGWIQASAYLTEARDSLTFAVTYLDRSVLLQEERKRLLAASPGQTDYEGPAFDLMEKYRGELWRGGGDDEVGGGSDQALAGQIDALRSRVQTALSAMAEHATYRAWAERYPDEALATDPPVALIDAPLRALDGGRI